MKEEIKNLIENYEEKQKRLWKGEYCGCWGNCNCHIKNEARAFELDYVIYDLKELINEERNTEID